MGEGDEFIFEEKNIMEGWSWGGSFGTFSMLVASQKWGLLAIYIISLLIPFINFISIIVFLILGGLKGKEWILLSNRFEDESEKKGAIKALEAVGFSYFIISMIFLIFYTIIFSLLITSSFPGIHM